MLPSLLTRDIESGVKQYLLGAYGAADPVFRGMMERFVERDGSWRKGPYVQMGLPFRVGAAGRDFFTGFQTRHAGYAHQEAAWRRLASAGSAGNTLVSTGTGSGKTECFLYPVLDHCARERAAGRPGVKALIVYPMNALASDQARRIAETIASAPAFNRVRAGLYVGGGSGGHGGMVMSSSAAITCHETLRESPPDILLTNYKMLDYLLVRPADRKLWVHNGPDTLRWIVVDELHTFDGAQGTDLALLLRRLKARLRASEGAVAHVGTSATLGAASDTEQLREYARQVFASPFPPESVVTEDRLNVDEFLVGDAPEHFLAPREDLERVLAPAAHASPEAAVAAWFRLFFDTEPEPPDVTDPAWRQDLGRLLQRHALFAALLRAVQGEPRPLPTIAAELAVQSAAAVRPAMGPVLDALLVLVAWARSPEDGALPFVTLRVQVWLRELRRMVALLTSDPTRIELRSSSDLGSPPDGVYLPLIQCAECHTTAWLSRVANMAESRLETGLDAIYRTWFSSGGETVRLYPGLSATGAQAEGVVQFACTVCGVLNPSGSACSGCGGERLAPVFRPTGQRRVVRDGRTAIYHDRRCPVCGASDAMVLIGSRSTTLGAQVVQQTWTSPYNDDRKLIAFSDSVQDAAHRAGFIGARTYHTTVRRAIARGVAHLVDGAMPWSEFRERFETLWQDPQGPFPMSPAEFTARFIGPNMAWQPAWTSLYADGATFPANSPLPGHVQRRLAWQAFAEFTYAGRRGRSLERIGAAVLAPPVDGVIAAAADVRRVLREQFGLEVTDRVVFWWLWGLVIHLRQIGAMFEPAMADYARDGVIWTLVHQGDRNLWMPGMGPHTIRPVFLTLGAVKGFEQLSASSRRTWYDVWVEAALAQEAVLLPEDRVGMYRAALSALQAVGIVRIDSDGKHPAAGLDPDRMLLHTSLAQLRTASGSRTLWAPEDVAARLLEMPCLDAPSEKYANVQRPGRAAADALRYGVIERVIAAEHTGLLERAARESVEKRFKSRDPQPWYENLLSATPTLELGVDIGDLSSVMLCTAPPSVASYLQRVGRAGRRDGSAHATTVADGASPHDLYFYEEPAEMIAGDVAPPGVFLQAPEVLRRQFCAYCLDDWVASTPRLDLYPSKAIQALDAVDQANEGRFPYTFCAYLAQNRERLVEAFLVLLGDNADGPVSDRLREFAKGDTEANSPHYRVVAALAELAAERKTYARRVKDLRTRVKALQAKPQDDFTKEHIDDLRREERNFQELVAEINGRDLLNTLTDAGFIPNYAFPETGIQLKSVLWRRATTEDRTSDRYVSLPALCYERPASSALSEFAPDNRFYANQRRVQVDQINLDMAKVEAWRLCANCQHMQNLEVAADDSAVCPRCGDAMWADSAQKRQLLRFRQAIANSDDSRVRIDDDDEDREPVFYQRQMLVDFTEADVREAWRLKDDALPFGFEFIASAAFRDVNFGEAGKTGETFAVASQATQRPGFRLCMSCGKVQPPPGPENPPGEVSVPHTYDCPTRVSQDPADVLECLYLYREFHSEALRILVPFTGLGVDDTVVHSFSAALQLGLKRRFGGQVDHLRVMIHDMPDPQGGPRRCYLLVYDSVPGGTGYLHQLLAHEAETLCEVFQFALDALEACRCQDDPEKDGCYRCVYQYRLGRQMQMVSRRVALSVLRDLVGALGGLERTPTISGIQLNSAIESVLERRFIESLRRLSKVGDLPLVTVNQEIVNGCEGYHLQVGPNRYTIEPQVDLGLSEGVKRASRPDFVIRPQCGTANRKPIAVFCDGWTYHRDVLREDAAKRTAILNSGRYWVWSVVMDDVDAAVQGEVKCILGSPYETRCNRRGLIPPKALAVPDAATYSRHAVAELLHWLETPCTGSDPWVENAWVASMGWLMRLVPEAGNPAAGAMPGPLPTWLTPRSTKAFDAALDRPVSFDIRGAWDLDVHRDLRTGEPLPTVLYLDDVIELQDSVARTEWRWWLNSLNWFQTVPGAVFVTRSGLEAQDYDALAPTPMVLVTRPGADAAGDAAWEEALGQVLGALAEDLRSLAASGCPPPDEVGYTLEGTGGEDASMAELTWIERRIAVLAGEYTADRTLWEGQGWNVIEFSPDWAVRARAALCDGNEGIG